MHDGCSGSFANGEQIVDKLRMMGFSLEEMQMPLIIECKCGEAFIMKTFESKCSCGMVYGVTPCHANSSENVMAAGINY